MYDIGISVQPNIRCIAPQVRDIAFPPQPNSLQPIEAQLTFFQSNILLSIPSILNFVSSIRPGAFLSATVPLKSALVFPDGCLYSGRDDAADDDVTLAEEEDVEG